MGRLFKKAVLLYPRFYEQSFWGFEHTLKKHVPRNKYGMPKRPLPPLGLMGLYRYLKENYYEKVVLIDRNVDPRPLKILVRDADHIFIGGMITQEKAIIDDIKILKKLGKKIIVGGTVVDESSPLMKMADHLVENESEMVIDKVMKGLADGTARKYYTGIASPPEKFFVPDFTSIDPNSYANMAIQISRGCPENCEFCDITARFGRNPRYTPWKQTEASLRQLYKLGYGHPLFIVDDNFIGNPSKTIEILKNICHLEDELKYSFSKYTELTMRLAGDTPLMKEMRYWLKRANFNMFFIGVETSNRASLVETGKFQNLQGEKSIQEKLKVIIKETGASVTTGMIHGFDSDTRSIDGIIKFINSTPSAIVMLGLLGSLPHTNLQERLEKERRLLQRPSGNNSDGRINFIPQNFSVKQAEEDYLKILKAIYSEKAYFKRVIKELELFSPNHVDNITKSKKEVFYSAFKLFTDRNFLILLKYLPKAHDIAASRFGFNTAKYRYLFATYFSLFGKFTHFKAQTKYLEKQIRRRKYTARQLYSWSEIQKSKILSIDVLEKAEKQDLTLYQKIRMKLDNGYEFVGTRLDALRHFTGPYIKEDLEKLKNINIPSLKNILDVEVDILSKVHTSRPNILGDIGVEKVKKQIRSAIKSKKGNLIKSYEFYKSSLKRMHLKKLYSV